MPIYEYECKKCGHEFEREQRISDPPVKTCPKCKGRKVTKLISQTSFVLKGGGWYADGYSDSKGNKKSDSSADTGSSSPDSSGDSDTKTKDAGKSKPKSKSKKQSAA